MKKLINVVEANESAFESLMGEQITVFSLNYIYHGKLIGVNDVNLLLENPKIVYETGKFSDKGFKDAQSLECNEFFIQIATIESFGVLGNKNG
jgi:hypothetical protein